MADPRRLLDEGASDFEARILAAGRKDAPSRAARRRIVTALGVGGSFPLALAAEAKAHVSAWLQTLSRGTLIKAGIGATLGAVAVWTGVELGGNEPAPGDGPEALARSTPALARSVAAVPDVPSVAEGSTSSLPPPQEPVTSPDVRSLPKRSGVNQEATPLSEEVSALERARRALSAGDAKRTLRLLDEYARKFQRPRLAAEAAVLRVEALVASGERERARQLAGAALARQPNGPYARRLRSLVGDIEEPRKSPP